MTQVHSRICMGICCGNEKYFRWATLRSQSAVVMKKTSVRQATDHKSPWNRRSVHYAALMSRWHCGVVACHRRTVACHVCRRGHWLARITLQYWSHLIGPLRDTPFGFYFLDWIKWYQKRLVRYVKKDVFHHQFCFHHLEVNNFIWNH